MYCSVQPMQVQSRAGTVGQRDRVLRPKNDLLLLCRCIRCDQLRFINETTLSQKHLVT